MDVKINAVGFAASSELEKFVNVKIGRLEKYNDGIVSMEAILKLEKDDTLENKLVEISVDVKGGVVFAKKQAKTFEEAIDQLYDVVKRQLVKNNEKIKAKR